ncbi:TonB family protein [Sphingomonas sp. KR1UV-12]|uniref:TonB family protein n=1 Tax=Sphingomonas aurea TaxID=3063994 RepID=A0ABT9ELY8_9SPHN|nr:TonB family protein [Sphingomonas sp. KR1UV-12]MDP1027977.1 TonB family protein [Sphingomonas sp. KR1UV-12]
MIRSLVAALTLIAVPAAAIPPAPPTTTNPADRPLIAWLPGPVRCAGEVANPVTMRRPLTALGWNGMTAAPAPVVVRFAIDAAGRPVSIARAEQISAVMAQDIEPSLAASRFAAGAPRQGCEVRYTLRITPMDATPVEDLASYTVAPDSGPLPQAGWDRLHPAGSTCFDPPRPQPLVRVLPEFGTLPATPGVRDWTLVGYDLDARGRPIEVRTVHGTGNRVLDAAGIKATRASRFTAGARTGCRYPYWRAPATLAAPEGPDPETLRPAGATCPDEGGAWTTPPRLSYPEPWRRRGIEGWAIVAFDVAPWGEPGNLRILASEPAEAFGQQAEQVIRAGRKAAAPQGRSGCIERVRFLMPPRGAAETGPAEMPID